MSIHRCTVCGSLVPPAAATCRVCGTPASAGMVSAALAEPAPVSRRGAAAAVDQLPVLVLAVGAVVLLVAGVPGWAAIAVGLAVAWTGLLWWWSASAGSSPGKRWLSLMVVQDSDGAIAPALPALARLVVRGGLCLVTLGVAGLSYRWDPDGRERTWWDRICATRVTVADHDRGVGSVAAVARWAPDASTAPDAPTAPRLPGAPAVVAVPGVLGAPDSLTVPVGRIVPVAAREVPRTDRADFLSRALVGDRFHAVPSVRSEDGSAEPSGAAGGSSAAAPVVITSVPSARSRPAVAGSGDASSSASADTQTGVPTATPAATTSSGVDESIFEQPSDAVAASQTAEIVWDTGRPVTVSGRVLIGRDPAAHPGEHAEQLLPVTTDSVGVSKTHLQLDVTAAGMTVTDRRSTNGVRVIRPDGSVERCPPGMAVPVRTGDVVHFGGRSLTRSR